MLLSDDHASRLMVCPEPGRSISWGSYGNHTGLLSVQDACMSLDRLSVILGGREEGQ